jgi:beta-glucanase (GH16 family)
MLISTFGCQRDDTQKLTQRNWQLSWSDEFDGVKGTVDSTKWGYDLGQGENGWGNAELQSYTDDTANVSVDGNGNLVITAINTGGAFTSARIKTKGLFSQKYGRIEARIKTPYGPGLWPAFWTLGANVDNVGWPQCGEIDIMELRGQKPEAIQGTIHGPGYSGGNSISELYALTDSRFDVDYHLFAIEWDADKIDFFVDDYLYQRISRDDVTGEWVYDQDFFIILNVAVGGNFVGFPTSDTPFPQKMYVDYVRVYKEI